MAANESEVPDNKGMTDQLWRYGAIAVCVGMAGVVIGTALHWMILVHQPNVRQVQQSQQGQAQRYAQQLDLAIMLLRQQFSALANSPSAKDALASFDATIIAATANDLREMLPHARRVDLIPRGRAAVDLNAEVPLSFSALDVINRAEGSAAVGPEAFEVGQQTLFYLAQPVLIDGTVGGVLFAAISMEYFGAALESLDLSKGLVQIEQRFPNTSPRPVLTKGEVREGTGRAISLNLNTPYWTLIFRPEIQPVAPLVNPNYLIAPLFVMLAMILGGVYLAFARMISSMRKDLGIFLNFLPRLVRGRAPHLDRYNLPLFQELAIRAQQAARAPLKEPTDPAAPEPRRAKAAASEKAGAKAAEKPAKDPLDIRSKPKGLQDELDDNFGIEVSESVSPQELGLKLDPLIFRAYDIRGIVKTNLTEDVVYWIGRAFGSEARSLDQLRVAVGCDGRLSSPGLKAALARGLQESGVDVIDIGAVPTPLLYYATHALNTGTGIMITGSHNPPEYNGLKMVLAGETLAEQRIQRLKERLDKNELLEGQGDYEEIELVEHYIDKVLTDVAIAQPLKIVVDCGNGIAGAVAPRLLEALGCEVVPLYCDVDGNFPNHHPDPAEAKNLEDLITVVKAEKADLGLAFDGDGDRLGVVTGSGEIVWPDKLLMLFAKDIVGRNPGADIIFDVKCSRHLINIISELGGRPIMWKTGHSHMKAKLKETGALLAGEFSGHICFGERWYGFDDALYSAARLLEIIGGEAQSVDELFAEFPTTYMTPEIKVHTTEEEKFPIMAQLAKDGDFGDGTLTDIDGIRIDYPDGWGLIRPSNTSPVLTLRFEADNEDALSRIQQLFQTQLQAISPNLGFLN